ncbi:MAG: GatB/YqeY domain-containing protein [Pseudomonadales bacterium]|nr:GatB/YqeY domain-containing protein [Pseudomonadales bacterium]
MASSIKNQLTESMKDAMRAKDKPRLGVIRLALSELKRVEVDERIELEDERVLVILDKMLKQRKDSFTQFTDAGRIDLADQEAFEVTVLKEFMPEPLSEDEIIKLIDDAISKTGAASMKEMGKVMGILKPQMQGRADMAEVSKVIKSRLG